MLPPGMPQGGGSLGGMPQGGGSPGGMPAPSVSPGAPAGPTPQMAKQEVVGQLRQAYSELRSIAAQMGIDWSEIERAGA